MGAFVRWTADFRFYEIDDTASITFDVQEFIILRRFGIHLALLATSIKYTPPPQSPVLGSAPAKYRIAHALCQSVAQVSASLSLSGSPRPQPSAKGASNSTDSLFTLTSISSSPPAPKSTGSATPLNSLAHTDTSTTDAPTGHSCTPPKDAKGKGKNQR